MTSPFNPQTKAEPVLVLGGRGFVGSHVTRALVALGCRPVLFGPPMETDLLAHMADAFDEIEGTIEDRKALHTALKTSGAHRIISMAAHSVGQSGLMRSGEMEADKALSVNVVGLRNLLDVAVEEKIERIIWTSSTVVYGQADQYAEDVVDEDAPSAPMTFYGLTKQMAEDIALYYRRRHHLPVTGLRLPLILGPGLWYRGVAAAIDELLLAAKTGQSFQLSAHDLPMDLMHVADVADAVTDAVFASGDLDATYNINGFTASMPDIVNALPVQNKSADITFNKVPADLHFPLVSDARFRAALSFEPRYDLERFVASMIQERQHQ